jgi:hypothetical protein
VGRLAQAGDRGQEVHVEEDVPADQRAVRLAPERDMTRGVAGRVEDGEPRGERIALRQRAGDGRAVEPCGGADERVQAWPPERRSEDHAAGLGRLAVAHAAPDGHTEAVGQAPHRAGVVIVRMGERDRRDAPSLEHRGDLLRRLLDAGVHQHVADEVRVDRVARRERQLPDVVGDREHGRTP